MKKIAVIPARSGSKGLPDKNIRIIGGKPLLAYTVESAIASGLFDRVHVSTDSEVYGEIARAYGADVPFLRSKDNAGDGSSSWDAVREVLQNYAALGQEFDLCVLLQPTSPLRTAEDIRSAYELYQQERAVTLTSVSEVAHPVQWCSRLDEAHTLIDLLSSPYRNSRRQELEQYYCENGAIYIVRTRDLFSPAFEFYSNRCVAFVMDSAHSVDIDTLLDAVVAEAILSIRSEGGTEQ